MSDTSDDSEGLYARIDELLAELDEACEISDGGQMPPETADNPLPELDLQPKAAPGPISSDAEEPLAEQPAEPLEAAAADPTETDGRTETGGELADPAAEVAADEPAPETETTTEPELTSEPEAGAEPEGTPSADDELLAAINAQLAELDEPEAERADDSPEVPADATQREPEPAPPPTQEREPTAAAEAEDGADTSSADVEMDASDLDDLVAELDAEQGHPPADQPSAAAVADEPERAKPAPPAVRSAPPPPQPKQPEPVSEPKTDAPAQPAASARPAPPPKPASVPKQRSYEPALTAAYRVGALALTPIGKVLDSQPRVVRDTIGWIGAITVFYAIFLWLFPLVFRGGAEPSENTPGVTIVEGAAEGE